MATELLRYEIRDGVAVITMDDGKANALSPQMIAQLNGAFDRAEDAASAVVLSGRSGRFSGGFDLTVMTGGVEKMRDLLKDGAHLLMRMYACPLPIVAACTGHALAAGALLLLASDRRIAAQGAFKIGLNEVSIQLPLPIFGMALARDRLSKRHFTQGVTQARIYDPDGAVDAGFLDATETAEKLADSTFELAAQLGGLPRTAFRETKLRERRATIDHVLTTLDDDITALTAPVPAQ